jgi:hypothetical protein
MYIDVDNINITVVPIDKESLDECTDIENMMMFIFGNNIGFADPKTFL